MSVPRFVDAALGRCGGRLARSSAARVAVAVFVAGSLLGASRSARSQTCPCPKVSMEQAVREASAIFVGKVVATTSRQSQPPVGGGSGQWRDQPGDVAIQEATMQVGEMLKGRMPAVAVVSSPAACGYPLAAGGTYLVFAARNDRGLWTDACKPNASGAAVPLRAVEVRRAVQPAHPR